jgi:hypothetical protein
MDGGQHVERELHDPLHRRHQLHQCGAGGWSGTFDSGIDRFDGLYTLAHTAGCSGTQIIALQGLGSGHTKHGISKGALEEFIATL